MHLLKKVYFIPCPSLRLFVREIYRDNDIARFNYLFLDGKLGNFDITLPGTYFFTQHKHHLYIPLFISTHAGERLGTPFPSLCSLLYGLIYNLSSGLKRKFYLNGLGYTLSFNMGAIKFNLGFTHVLSYTLPRDLYIRITSHKNNQFIPYGVMKQTITSHAVSIRGHRVPDVYKGKGILYEYEVNNISLKKGKKQMI